MLQKSSQRFAESWMCYKNNPETMKRKKNNTNKKSMKIFLIKTDIKNNPVTLYKFNSYFSVKQIMLLKDRKIGTGVRNFPQRIPKNLRKVTNIYLNIMLLVFEKLLGPYES